MNAFDRLRAIETCYRTARFALERLLARIRSDPTVLHASGLTPRDFARSLAELEGTYLVRLFAEFESIVAAAWRTIRTKPRARRTVAWVEWLGGPLLHGQ